MKSYSIREFAESVGVDERTVRAWISSGELAATNVSRNRLSKKPRLRITERQADAFLDQRSTRFEQPDRRRRPKVEQFV